MQNIFFFFLSAWPHEQVTPVELRSGGIAVPSPSTQQMQLSSNLFQGSLGQMSFWAKSARVKSYRGSADTR